MSCPYQVLQYLGTQETCSPLIYPSTLVRKSFMRVREVQLVRYYVGTLVTCSPLLECWQVSTLVICDNLRGDFSTLVRWYTRDMQSFNRPQYVGTQVIHACSRSVVSTLVSWYASEMRSSDRALVHKDVDQSWLSQKWSQYASTLVHKRNAVL